MLLFGYLSFHVQDSFVTGPHTETELKQLDFKINIFLSHVCIGPFRNVLQYFSPDVKFSVSYVNIYHFFEKWKPIDLMLRKILSRNQKTFLLLIFDGT